MRFVIAVLFFLVYTTSYSQTGSLEIYFYTDSLATYTLERQDSIYKSGDIDYEVSQDSLPVGNYMLKIYVEGGLLLTYSNLMILEDKTTSIDLSCPSYYSNEEYVNDKNTNNQKSKVEVGINLKMGHTSFETKERLLKYHVEIGENFNFYSVSKYFSVAYSTGFNISLSKIRSDTSFFPTPPYNFERFVYLTYNNGVLFRLTGYNNRILNKRGPVIDVGAFYNFPISFRHVGSMNHTKTKTNRLHRFNDFSAKLLVGFYPVVVTAEYRFFDFVKPGYTQLPKLNLGVNIYFGE